MCDQSKILLIRGKRICLYPSVYLDQHGEEDEFLKRGRPLFLNKRRYGALEDLWVNGAALRREGVTQTIDELAVLDEIDAAVATYYEGVE